ncbi:MAG: Na+/H+ antiporter NhaC family protein [Lacipirellulaceae bacterium]
MLPPLSVAAVDPSWLCLLPCAVVFALALATRRTVGPLVVGALLGLATLQDWAYPFAAAHATLDAFAVSLLKVMRDETIGWLLLVCGLFGAVLHLQATTGCAEAVGEVLAKFVRGPRGVRLTTFGLGLVVFVDDYLNALAVGSTMRGLADRHGVSRAMLAYVVDSTAAPVCVLVPASTWAFYVAGLLETQGLAPVGEGLSAYIGLLPTFVYAWAALLLVLLVSATGWPLFGAMRSEELAAQQAAADRASDAATQQHEGQATPNPWPGAIAFVAPLVALGLVIFCLPASDGARVLKGVLVAAFVALAAARLTTRVPLAELGKRSLQGIGQMVPTLAIVVVSFVLKDANDALGLTPYVIDAVRPWLTTSLLPAAAFVGLSLVTFTTGSFWGTYAVALPILVPLAREVGADVPLTVGAVVSAGAFGSHACFYGDATVLSSSACGVPNMTHCVTQAPYAALAAAATLLVYLGWGLLG